MGKKPTFLHSYAHEGPVKSKPEVTTLRVRPYQLMCAICSLGGPLPNDGRTEKERLQAGRLRNGGPLPKDGRVEKVDRLKAAVRENPDVPITLVCNAGDLFAHQDPGTADDTPEGADYNRKRDLDILQKMNWPPGITLPARVIFMSLFSTKRRPQPIPTAEGVCGYGPMSVPGWEGCPKTQSGDYEKGLTLGVGSLIPQRPAEEMAQAKEESLAAMYAAGEVTVRPHLLLCAVCQYAAGERPPFLPDNLPEFLQMILKEKPDINIRFVREADWMMCGPCPYRVPGKNACSNVVGSGGLSNEKRDLDVLQQLGLHFGSVMKARDLYRLIFEKVTKSMTTCKREGSGPTSVWWDRGCGDPNPETRHQLYEQGREELKDKFNP